MAERPHQDEGSAPLELEDEAGEINLVIQAVGGAHISDFTLVEKTTEFLSNPRKSSIFYCSFPDQGITLTVKCCWKHDCVLFCFFYFFSFGVTFLAEVVFQIK